MKSMNGNIKDSTVETPEFLAEIIFSEVKRKPFKNILDIGAYRGNLSKPFKRKADSFITGLDILRDYEKNFDNFIYKDFLETKRKDFPLIPDLVISNPPFQSNKEHNKLYPELFLDKIFQLFGKTQPVIMIVGHWFLSNSSKRIDKLNEYNITKTMTLHKSIFKPMSVEASVLFFNIKTKKPHEFIDFQKPKQKIYKSRTVALSKAQQEFIKEEIPNFSKEVKELLKNKFPDFPV